jgi:hypothetical protein
MKNKMLDYVPKEFQARFNAIEKITCDIRRQSKGLVQTNLRKSATDFVLRTRDRCTEPTSWNNITPTILPKSLPIFEINLSKNAINNQEKDNNKYKKKSRQQ